MTIIQKVHKCLEEGHVTYAQILEQRPELKEDQIKRALQHLRKKEEVPNLRKGSNKEVMHSSRKRTSSPSFPCSSSLLDRCITLHGPSWGTLLAFILSPGGCADGIMVPAQILAACHPDNIKKVKGGYSWDKSKAKDTEALLPEAPYQLMLDSHSEGDKNYKVVFHLVEPNIEELLQLAWEDSELVDGFTGKPWSPPSPGSTPSDFQPVEELRQLLNSQDIDYSKFQKRLAVAFEMAKELPLAKRMHQVSILRQLKVCMSPHYSAKSNTLRLYADGPSLQNLNRNLRAIVFEGELQLDLSHCQFSVLASTWNIPLLQQYQENLWGRLTTETKLNDKDSLKTLIYSAAYGSQKEKARQKLMVESGCTIMQSYKVFEHPVFHQLFTQSEAKMKELAASGEAKDAFGRPLVVKSTAASYKAKSPKSKGSLTSKAKRSILAAQAQSYELKLLTQAVSYLISKGVKVMLWLHDGIIVSKDTPMSYIEAAKAFVEQEAKGLGINTSLELETISPGK